MSESEDGQVDKPETTIAQRLFDGDSAKGELYDVMSGVGAEFDHLGWDYYDCSLGLAWRAMVNAALKE